MPCTSSVGDDALLLIVGGASGAEGDGEVARARQLVDELGLHDRVRFVPPQPHHILSSYYRAADVVIVPSRSESFGLVALEAAACGIPVVASAVGGLQSLVDDGETGFLIAAARSGRVRGGDHPHPRRPVAGGVDVGRRRRRGPSATRGASPPPGCGGSTPTSPLANSSCASEPAMTDLHAGDRLADLRRRIDAWADRLARRQRRRSPPSTAARATTRRSASRAGTSACAARRRTSSPCG